MTLALGLLVSAFTGAAHGQIDSARAAPSGETLIARFLESRIEPLTQFRGVRHLEATNERFRKHGWMDVVTELSADGRFTFEVLVEGGSSYIRKRVLLPILEGEREIVSRGDAARAALTAHNYDISGEEPAGSGLVHAQ